MNNNVKLFLEAQQKQKVQKCAFLKFVITVNSFFKTLHQNLTISCFNLYSVDSVHYISSGFLQKYLSVIVTKFPAPDIFSVVANLTHVAPVQEKTNDPEQHTTRTISSSTDLFTRVDIFVQ